MNYIYGTCGRCKNWKQYKRDDGIFVKFDIKPKGWDKELCVSVNCLKLS